MRQARYSATKLVERSHWVRRGKRWRLVTEELTELDYARTFHEQPGWRHGARIKSVSTIEA